MNPITRLYRRSRAFRIFAALLILPAWQILVFVADDDLQKYSTTGDAVLLAGWMFFALWAWWYTEDRERRRAGKAAQANGSGQRNDDGR
jgi:hypothetical protein